MRRSKQLLPESDSLAILAQATSGVLALYGPDGYPYAVPMSYVYQAGKIYFHCAINGHKIEAIRHCGKASFCVIDKDEVIPSEYTTYFRSVIVFGHLTFVTQESLKIEALRLLANKYSPHEKQFEEVVHKSLQHVCIIEMDIERITGKQAIELVK